ncbi:hypothetical protein [Candidatus Tisiphia endosymbiont of Beris chalybata]|uniref:hypothetical protein n=1 Tax=Candidatus Tisiphia endosymbiont of Beris chalybata TaxID=3066262 RepID=UPI00312C9DC6
MRILNFKCIEKFYLDQVRELDWGAQYIKDWQPTYPSFAGNYNTLKGALVTALVITFPYANATKHFSIVNSTVNATHVSTTTQHGDDLLTTVVTANYTTLINTALNGEFLGKSTTYVNGNQEVTAPHDKGTATRYTKKGSKDIKIIYKNEKNNIVKTETLYANETFLEDFINGTTRSTDRDDTRIETDLTKIQTTYANGTEIITSKIEPIKTVITHPDGMKITKFKNGTITEKDKYGGKIVKRDNNIEISYNDSELKITGNKWEVDLGGDENPRQEL